MCFLQNSPQATRRAKSAEYQLHRVPLNGHDAASCDRDRAAPVHILKLVEWSQVIAVEPSPRSQAAALNDPCSATATDTRIWRILSDDSMILDVHSSKCAPALKDHSAQSPSGQKASCVFYIAKRYFRGHSGKTLPLRQQRVTSRRC